MKKFGLRLAKLFLDIATTLVPKRRYQAKIDAIQELEARHRGQNLRGWELKRIPAHQGEVGHSFFFHPSSRQNAPTLLLLHGLNLDGRSYLNLDGLADHYNLMAYNWPEVSDKYHGRVDDFVEVIDDFISATNLDSCVIAGVSLGGMVAPIYAAKYPDRVCALILISTKIPNMNEVDHLQGRLIDDLVRKSEDYQVYWIIELFTMRFLSRLNQMDRARAAAFVHPKHIEFYRQSMAAMRDLDGAFFARKVHAPVLVLHGTRDEIMSLESLTDLRRALPQAQVEMIRDAGHMMVAFNADQLEGHIRKFLSTLQFEPH
jgi:pimeloyl-ACP methyl ester carboxylesterase